MKILVVVIFILFLFSGCAMVGSHEESVLNMEKEKQNDCQFRIQDVIIKKGGFESLPECL